MSAFDKNKKFGGNKFGKKPFGGGGRGGFGGGRGGFGGGRGGSPQRGPFGGGDRDRGERPPLHDAVCSECGQTCQVPFRPTGDRPVYCNSCFQAQKSGAAPRHEERNFDNDRPVRNDNKQLFDAVCSKCGNTCQVPFKPMPGKPVFCTSCFEKPGTTILKNVESFKDQFELLNSKLDKIMQSLSLTDSAEKKDEAKSKPVVKKVAKKKK